VVETAVVGGDNLVCWLKHLGVDKTLDTVAEHVLGVDWLHGRLGNLQHDGPVWTLGHDLLFWLGAVGVLHSCELDGGDWLVVWRVVGEDGGAVEWAVVLWEVEPALVANALWTLATDTNTNDVCAAVEKTLGEIVELGVAHGLGQVVDAHSGNELLVLNGGAVTKLNLLVLGVNLLDGSVLTEAGVFLWESVGHGDPDTTSTALGREAESSVWTPVTGGLLENDVLGNALEVWSRDPLTEPLALHLRRV